MNLYNIYVGGQFKILLGQIKIIFLPPNFIITIENEGESESENPYSQDLHVVLNDHLNYKHARKIKMYTTLQ
jgi:hypothetical protein